MTNENPTFISHNTTSLPHKRETQTSNKDSKYAQQTKGLFG
jgi:hypothetical protein